MPSPHVIVSKGLASVSLSLTHTIVRTKLRINNSSSDCLSSPSYHHGSCTNVSISLFYK